MLAHCRVRYYEGSEDYYTHTCAGGLDFHVEEGLECGPNCTRRGWEYVGAKGSVEGYSTNLFSSRAEAVINDHDSAAHGLFLYLAYQGVHSPRESPTLYSDPYLTTIKNRQRREFAGMISALDEGLGHVTGKLCDKSMLDDTLFIVTTGSAAPPARSPIAQLILCTLT